MDSGTFGANVKLTLEISITKFTEDANNAVGGGRTQSIMMNAADIKQQIDQSLHFNNSSDDDDDKQVHSESTVTVEEVGEMDVAKQEFIRDEIVKVEQTLAGEIESLSHQIQVKQNEF